MSVDPTIAASLREAQRALAERDYKRVHVLCTQILVRAPKTADAFFLLAMLAADHDNLAKAIDVIDRALLLEPQRAEYWAQKGRLLLALSRPKDALEAARAGIAGEVDSALTWDTLGVLLTRAGAHSDAIVPFKKAVATDSSKSSYHYNLGAALQFDGDFAAAEAAYRAALALQPQMHRAWSALAQVRKQPFDEQETAQLERMLGNPQKPAENHPQLSADAELQLCHALAKQREDQQRYAESFALLDRGKSAKREDIRYDIAQDLALFDAAERGAEQLPQNAAGYGSEEPIFIVGMPRTGTTLVERILSSHPQVYAAGELSHFSLALKRASGSSGAHVLDPQTLRSAGQANLAEVGANYIESTRPRTGQTPRFIDKMPLNFFYAAIIRNALPQAKIICLRRHPLDTVLSNYRQLFATGFSYYNYAYDLLDTARYWQAFDRLIGRWRTQLGDGFIEVHYEAVVEDIEAQARRLLAHCDLPWDPACLDFHRNTAAVATASSVQVRQPLYRSALQRWRLYREQLLPAIELLGLEDQV